MPNLVADLTTFPSDATSSPRLSLSRSLPFPIFHKGPEVSSRKNLQLKMLVGEF